MVRRVLFVDDDEILRLAVEGRFRSFGDVFSLITARDGFDAVKILAKVSVSLVVLDLIMPRMDGMSLLAHIRENYPDIPVIIVSSMAAKDIQELARANSVEDYFEKPFLADELGAAIIRNLQAEADGGTMVDVSPTVFLQLMEMDGKSCTIRIFDNKTGDGGVLYFLDGELLDARIGKLHGIDAARKVFTWEHATVYMHNHCEPRENVIQSGLQSIIMEAVTFKDEAEDEEGFVTEPIATLSGDGDGAEPVTPFEGWGDHLEGVCTITRLSRQPAKGTLVEKLHDFGKLTGLGQFESGYADGSRILLADDEVSCLDIEKPVDRELVVQRLRKTSVKK